MDWLRALDEVSPLEFDYLIALESFEPWGDLREDLRSFRSVQLNAAAWGSEIEAEHFDYLGNDEDDGEPATMESTKAGLTLILGDPQ